jgi:hypothetical protein
MTTSQVNAELDWLRKKGFVQASRGLTRYFYLNPEEMGTFARFAFGIGTNAGNSLRYSGMDLLGQPTITYYYQVDRKERLIEHLEILFLTKNNSPTAGMTEAFTFLMHGHNFHWSRCLDRPRPIGSRGPPRGVPNPRTRRNLTLDDLEKLKQKLDGPEM